MVQTGFFANSILATQGSSYETFVHIYCILHLIDWLYNFCQTHLPRTIVPSISHPFPGPCSVGCWLVKEDKVGGMRSTSRITS